MFFVHSVNYTRREYMRSTVDVHFEATTNEEAWALYNYFCNLIGKPIDPYKVKPDAAQLKQPTALPHVPQLHDNTSTETKGQHE